MRLAIKNIRSVKVWFDRGTRYKAIVTLKNNTRVKASKDGEYLNENSCFFKTVEKYICNAHEDFVDCGKGITTITYTK
ncbi:hypothetical protein J6Q66_08980 [bacterium]|nr:hypothetical protein [bacterium]